MSKAKTLPETQEEIIAALEAAPPGSVFYQTGWGELLPGSGIPELRTYGIIKLEPRKR
jgi:hypothetical protein